MLVLGAPNQVGGPQIFELLKASELGSDLSWGPGAANPSPPRLVSASEQMGQLLDIPQKHILLVVCLANELAGL